MAYRIPLPEGSRLPTMDLVEPNSTAVQRALRRDGLSAYEPPTAATLLALFETLGPGFTFFDVGANMGLYALLASMVFEPGAVHAFEPTPSTVTVLRKIVRANRVAVEVVAAALGAENGTARLHLSDKSDASNSLVEGFKVSSDGLDVPVLSMDFYVAENDIVPDVVKIDVETFEPSVIAGATQTIEQHRPFIVLEVLNRKGRDHGVEITEAIAPFGYSYYELTVDPTWQTQPAVRGRAGQPNHDWLLAPTPLPESFASCYDDWRRRLDACGPDRNSRVPLRLSVRAAMKRGGLREVAAAARRYLARS